MECLIVGGGIAGLTLALSLAKYGIRSQVFEKDGYRYPRGFGLQLSPNCTSLLDSLPLSRSLADECEKPKTLRIVNGKSNLPIYEVALNPSSSQDRSPGYYQVHRFRLLDLLSESARLNPNISLHTKVHIEHLGTQGDSVVVGTSSDTFTGDCLFGCDGSDSIVRNYISSQNVDLGKGRTTKYMAFRTTYPLAQVPESFRDIPSLFLGTRRHVVTYPLQKDRVLNLVAVIRPRYGNSLSRGTESPTNETLLNELKRWRSPLRELFYSFKHETVYAQHPSSWLPSVAWTMEKPVFLVGDAFHTVLPYTAQGAALAIEDAVLLAFLLSKHQNASHTRMIQSIYHEKRRKRALLINQLTRLSGLAYHVPNWLASVRNLTIPTGVALAKSRIHEFSDDIV